MYRISKWFNNYQAPVVLMIDDLSDAYVEVFNETYKNDWGYLCDGPGSSYDFLKNSLLKYFPLIKITFFVPYLRHNVISDHSQFKVKKYALGERKDYTDFLIRLKIAGHEIAHHGSNHGQYLDPNIPSTANNWTHEWALYKDRNEGMKTILTGVNKFHNECHINIVGGKYCGHTTINNSKEIIDKCNFLYWCDKPSYMSGKADEHYFGKNNIISFPINFSGNSFIKLKYLTGHTLRDKKKKFFKYFQFLYSFYSYIKLYKLYKNSQIISIQEHNSPSTTAGTIQAVNIVTDIDSLKKIFSFLNNLSIWYATCEDIAKYIYIREQSKIEIINNELHIIFDNNKKLNNTIISITSPNSFVLEKNGNQYHSIKTNSSYTTNLPIVDGRNIFSANIP